MVAYKTDHVLSPGNFFGTTLRSYEATGFRICETSYEGPQAIPAHSHELPFLCYVLKGSFHEIRQKRNYDCQQGTVIFHPANDGHSDFVEPLERMRCLNIEMNTPWKDTLQVVLREPCKAWSLKRPETSTLAMRVYREFRSPDDLSNVAIEGLILELLAAGLRGSMNFEKAPPWLEKIHTSLQERYTESLSLEELALEAGVHRVHLARSFRKHYGSTVADYVRKLRIDFACRSLQQTDSAIAIVCARTGFFDQSHFTKTFRRFTGMTPAEFRKLHR